MKQESWDSIIKSALEHNNGNPLYQYKQFVSAVETAAVAIAKANGLCLDDFGVTGRILDAMHHLFVALRCELRRVDESFTDNDKAEMARLLTPYEGSK